MNRKVLTSLLAVAGLATAGVANASLVVDGVDWGFAGSHLETTTLAETFVNGVGQHLVGYGVINTINGASDYTPSDADRLYFVFDYTVSTFTPTAASFDSGTVSIYKGAEYNLLSQSSVTNLATIQSYTQFLQLAGHADSSGHELSSLGFLTGTNVAFFGTGLLDVVLGGFGSAGTQALLNTNTEFDGVAGFADIHMTSSGSNGGTLMAGLNTNDDLVGCNTGQARPGQWCIAGSADLRGASVVPEPGSLALAGLGLFGLAAARRRKAAV